MTRRWATGSHTHTHTHTHTHNVHTDTHTHIHRYTQRYTHTHAYMHRCTHTHIQRYKRAHTYTHRHTYTYTRTYTHTRRWATGSCTHTDTHIHCSARCQASRVCMPPTWTHKPWKASPPETRSWISRAGTGRLWHQRSRPWVGGHSQGQGCAWHSAHRPCRFLHQPTHPSRKISTNFPKRLELSFLTVLALPKDSRRGVASRI